MKGQLAKCGIILPVELSNALASADEVIKTIESAQSADDLEAAINQIEGVGEVMQEWGPRLGELPRLCQMVKQAEKDYKQIQRDATRLERRVKANKKVDLSELLAEFKQEVAKLGEALKQAKELLKSDPESAIDKLEDEFYGQRDNLESLRQAIETAINISQGLKQAAQEIKNFAREIQALKKKKLDTQEAEGLLANLKVQVEEIRQLVKTRGFDPEELVDKVEAAFETREQLSDALEQLRGSLFTSRFKAGKGVNFELPSSFRRTTPQSGFGGEGENGGPGSGSSEPGFGAPLGAPSF